MRLAVLAPVVFLRKGGRPVVEINLFVVFLIGVIPALIIATYLLARRPEVKHSKFPSLEKMRLETNVDKLFHSKVTDNTIFDGKSPDYTEARQRFRQTGGALVTALRAKCVNNATITLLTDRPASCPTCCPQDP